MLYICPFNKINVSDITFNPTELGSESSVNYKNQELLLKTSKFIVKDCTSKNNYITFEAHDSSYIPGFGYHRECTDINKFLLELDALIATPQIKKQLFGENCDIDKYHPWIDTKTDYNIINWECKMRMELNTTVMKINERVGGGARIIPIYSISSTADNMRNEKVMLMFRLKIWLRKIFDDLVYGVLSEITEIDCF